MGLNQMQRWRQPVLYGLLLLVWAACGSSGSIQSHPWWEQFSIRGDNLLFNEPRMTCASSRCNVFMSTDLVETFLLGTVPRGQVMGVLGIRDSLVVVSIPMPDRNNAVQVVYLGAEWIGENLPSTDDRIECTLDACSVYQTSDMLHLTLMNTVPRGRRMGILGAKGDVFFVSVPMADRGNAVQAVRLTEGWLTRTCTGDSCRSLDGNLFCSGAAHALALVDQRLYHYIYNELHAYLQAACSRRGFAIELVGVANLDQWRVGEVRNFLLQKRSQHPSLEGVLFVGNVPMPTFFMPFSNDPVNNYWPRFYQDLDMKAEKTIPDGASLQACGSATDSSGYPADWPCMSPTGEYSAPFAVPPHDFDRFGQGTQYGIELWAAFLPVGYEEPYTTNGTSSNCYRMWGEQLKPFFQKVLRFYNSPGDFASNLYHVGNDVSMLGQLENMWNLLGPGAIDYYAINTFGPGQCADNPDCYSRAPLETFASLESFLGYANTLSPMGEGWQSATVFLSHLNSGANFPRKVVWWNVHSGPTDSLIRNDQARQSISLGKGGLVALLDGCRTGKFAYPNDTRVAEGLKWIPPPDKNILVSLVYGQGAFIAAVGSIIPKNAFDHFGELLDNIYTDGYLGLADKLRNDATDRDYSLEWGFREHQEILVGDPFVDAQ